MADRTVIIIAHRVEAVKNADFCLVLGKGELLEAGRPEDILLRAEPASIGVTE